MPKVDGASPRETSQSGAKASHQVIVILSRCRFGFPIGVCSRFSNQFSLSKQETFLGFLGVRVWRRWPRFIFIRSAVLVISTVIAAR